LKDFKRHITQKHWLVTVSAILLIASAGCKKNEVFSPQRLQSGSALQNIQNKGRLDIITDYNSTSYFLYRGTPMGFNYEVMRAFADHLGVQLNIRLVKSIDEVYSSLSDGTVDMVCMDLPMATEKEYTVSFTDPIINARPVLVQRKPDTGGKGRSLVTGADELSGKSIYVEKGSQFMKMLTMLSITSKEGIHIIEHPEYKTEQLIDAVSGGKIDYTVAYEPVAEVNRKYHNNIDIHTVIGHDQDLVWSVSKESQDLLDEFNNWLSSMRKSKKLAILYEKYYVSDRSVRIVDSEMYSVKGGKISPYDQSIRKHSRLINWDWRLVASLVYKESRFHPEAQAWSGASGLMQLMPDVAEKYGVDSLSQPSKQIEAGIRYLQSLDKQFAGMIKDKEERIKFVLAAYNVGLGHVLDARRLAAKYGKNNNIWTNNVDTFLLKKSEPRYYNDRLAYYGYCRGQEPFTFVKDVMEIYQLYRNAIHN
jgi:membrane-bound lytic murein transglycosylase F